MRTRAKVDDNQKEVVTVLRKLGYSILHTHQLGKGAPDFIVGYEGGNLLVELKDGLKSADKRQLTSDEKVFHSQWKGDILVAKNVAEIYRYIQKLQLR